MSRALALFLGPVVFVQGARLRRTIPPLAAPPGDRTGGTGKLRLVVVGDSTAVGTGANSPADAIPGRLGQLLDARWRVVGANGLTAADVLRDHIRDAAGGPADVAVLLVGWNDAMKLRSGRAFARDLAALIERLKSVSPKGRVVVVGAPVFADFAALPQPLRMALGAHAAGLAKIAERVADEHEVDYAPGFDGRSVTSDGFHPDGEGYAGMSAAIARTLKP